MILDGADAIIIEIKGTINVMCLNHPQIIPPHHLPIHGKVVLLVSGTQQVETIAVDCRVLSSILDFSPLGASSRMPPPSQTPNIKTASSVCLHVWLNVSWREGAKMPLVENHCSINISTYTSPYSSSSFHPCLEKQMHVSSFYSLGGIFCRYLNVIEEPHFLS